MDKENNNKELTENEDIFKNCPYCSEKILLNAIKCKYCGEWLNKKEKKEKRKKKIGKMFLNFFLYFIIYFVISAVIKAIFFSENPDVTGKMFVIDILVILTVIVSFFIIKKAKKNDEYYGLLLLLLAVVSIVFISIIRKGQAISFKVNTSMLTSYEEYNKNDNEVFVYFFWGDECPYSASQKNAMDDWVNKYPNIKIKTYETWSDINNRAILESLASAYNTTVQGVPMTFIGDQFWIGYADFFGEEMQTKIDECTKVRCEDAIKRID